MTAARGTLTLVRILLPNNSRTSSMPVSLFIVIAGLCAFFTNCAQDNEQPETKNVTLVEVQSAAARGDAKSQFDLGLRYATGQSVPQDFAQAVAWYRKAAEQGIATACRRTRRKRPLGTAKPRNKDLRRRSTTCQ